MYYTSINSIDIPFLHDAALVCGMKGYNLRNLYIDKNGECAVAFWGTLSINDIATIIQNFWVEELDFPKALKKAQSGLYHEWFTNEISKDQPHGFTMIYTPDNINYTKL